MLLLLVSSVAAALAVAADPPAYSVCRYDGGTPKCLQVRDAGCRGGVMRSGWSPEPRACPRLAGAGCKTVAALLKDGSDEIRALPKSQRDVDPSSPMRCRGLYLTTPEHTVVSCSDTQAEGAVRILDFYEAVGRSCGDV